MKNDAEAERSLTGEISSQKRGLRGRSGVQAKTSQRRLGKPGLGASLRRPAKAPWRPGEMLRMKELMAGTGSPEFIAQRLSNLNGRLPVRTAKAVRCKAARCRPVLNFPGYKRADVAALLGASLRQVQRWVDNGYLESKAGRITERSVEDLIRKRGRLLAFEKLTADQRLYVLGCGYRGDTAGSYTKLKGADGLAAQLIQRESERITVKEAAILLGVSARCVRHWIERKMLPRTNEPGVRKSDLIAFLESHPGFVTDLPEQVMRWLKR